MSCMRFEERTCMAVRGQRTSLIKMVTMMMVKPQFGTKLLTPVMIIRRSLLMMPKKPNCMTRSWFWPRDSSLLNSLGPT